MKNNIILGIFLFGTSRVGEFLEKGFRFISVGNDLHHILMQSGAYVNDIEKVAKGQMRDRLDQTFNGFALVYGQAADGA
jgi:hypothetical protein